MVFDEIIPTLDMKKEELEIFAEAVFDRFRNPFIKHQLASIALNSIAKFKVRVLPSLLEYVKRTDVLPMRTVFTFACLIRFYKGTWNGKELPINDDKEIVAEMAAIWKLDSLEEIVSQVLGKTAYWDEDLNKIEGLTQAIATYLQRIDEYGIKEAFLKLS